MIKNIFSYSINSTGKKSIEKLKENKYRRYSLDSDVFLSVETNVGSIICKTKEGFIFDGRSGGKLIDFFIPNLGAFEERIAWLIHDCLGYGQSLSFKDTNLLLKCFLKDKCNYKSLTSSIIYNVVSISKKWYGWPDDDDEWAINKGLVETFFIPNKAFNLK